MHARELNFMNVLGGSDGHNVKYIPGATTAVSIYPAADRTVCQFAEPWPVGTLTDSHTGGRLFSGSSSQSYSYSSQYTIYTEVYCQ